MRIYTNLVIVLMLAVWLGAGEGEPAEDRPRSRKERIQDYQEQWHEDLKLWEPSHSEWQEKAIAEAPLLDKMLAAYRQFDSYRATWKLTRRDTSGPALVIQTAIDRKAGKMLYVARGLADAPPDDERRGFLTDYIVLVEGGKMQVAIRSWGRERGIEHLRLDFDELPKEAAYGLLRSGARFPLPPDLALAFEGLLAVQTSPVAMPGVDLILPLGVDRVRVLEPDPAQDRPRLGLEIELIHHYHVFFGLLVEPPRLVLRLAPQTHLIELVEVASTSVPDPGREPLTKVVQFELLDMTVDKPLPAEFFDVDYQLKQLEQPAIVD